MLFLVKFAKPADPDEDGIADLIIDAPDGDIALEAVKRHGIDDPVARLVEVPPGLFCCEVLWSNDDDDEEEEPNAANLSDAGVVLEVSDAFADFLEADDRGVVIVAVPDEEE